MSSENGAYRGTSNIGECSYGSCLRIRWVETTSKFYRSRINFPDRSSFPQLDSKIEFLFKTERFG